MWFYTIFCQENCTKVWKYLRLLDVQKSEKTKICYSFPPIFVETLFLPFGWVYALAGLSADADFIYDLRPPATTSSHPLYKYTEAAEAFLLEAKPQYEYI